MRFSHNRRRCNDMTLWSTQTERGAVPAGPSVVVRLLLVAMLAGTTLFVYWESFGHGFVTMDDYPYVVDNEETPGAGQAARPALQAAESGGLGASAGPAP